ncbi:5-hydroxyisourate hydrolase-like protein (transthyretin family) [Pelomonas aquatica]|uniref:5-hydroxyisourate hydrolase-like protein (Transthyretin family) n=1 Tax=Pelomonas aquatica TaxID=431058 RepID=A0ABU1ZBJ7_9BURK|nr:Ig-like domain-containing protein [Pelomonas aquatica]MDR7298000.1 5-hydroxyisourate hydrolase-like protein (transthyretin family) [Pelomonas aquatica]
MLQTIVTQGWRRLARAALGLGMTAFLSACGGGGGSAGDPTFPCTGASCPGGGTTGPTAADLVVTLSGSTLPTDGTGSVLVTVYAVDAKRNTIADVPVSISVDQNALVSTTATKTDTSGVVTGTVRIGSDESKRTITVTAASGSITKTAQISVVTPSPTGNTTGPALTVALSATQITPAVGSTVTVQLRSSTGAALPDVVVSLATGRGNLANLSVATVRTDANGQATAQLTASPSGVTGADYVTAIAAIGSTTVSAQQAFTVTNALPTLTVNPASVTLRLSQPAPEVTATLRNAAGQPVANQVVTFAPVSTGNMTVTPGSAPTDANGVARTTLKLSTTAGTTSATDALRVSATYAEQALVGNVIVQIVGESPTAAMTLSSSNLSGLGASSKANVLVRDVGGNPAAGQLVQFSSQFGLVKFDASTAVTDATGVASVNVTPATGTSNGADVVRANVTVAGIAATDSKPVQVVSATSPGAPVLQLGLSSTSVSSAVPATVTATLTDSRGLPVAGQVVTFAVIRGLGRTNVGTALTDATGKAVALLSPATSASAGADEVTATVQYAGTTLSATQGFQVQATNATIVSFTGPGSLSAYGQDTLTIVLTGAAVDSPVKLSVSSSCAAAGKATVSPASISATSNTVTLQYRDNGCGAVQPTDLLQVVIDGTSTARQLTLPISAPAAVSLAFISSVPEQIFLKGSGFTESSIITFEVRDAAGNPLPNKVVELRLQTGAGGVTMEGRGVESVDPLSPSPFTQTSNALGRVQVRVNSGTQPTPVRVHAKLSGENIATVSSNLSVGIGLPSQLNFSMSQQTINIEGYNIDNVPNTYTLIAADRSSNPVPIGTTINFVAEGGQVESNKLISQTNGISQATSNFVSAQPKPVDGRVTVVAFALGEESFIDKNGNNIYDSGEEFQDLGNIFKDRNYDGIFDASFDEFLGVNLPGNTSSTCVPPTTVAIFGLNAYSPSVPGTCDGKWTGSGQIYVRRAVETVLSTSTARPLWPGGDSRVAYVNSTLPMQTGPSTSQVTNYRVASGDTICNAGTSGSFTLLAADANPGLLSSAAADPSLAASYVVLPRLNPMPAGTVVTVSTPTTGFSVSLAGGSPVPNTSQANLVGIGYNFDTASFGTVTVTFTSPRGTGTSFSFGVSRAGACP